MKAYGEVEVSVHAFLSLALEGGSCTYTSGERGPGIHLIEAGWAVKSVSTHWRRQKSLPPPPPQESETRMLCPPAGILFTTSTDVARPLRGSVVGSGTVLQAGRSRVRVPMRWIFFSN
jgi:hypothetical protein